MSSEELDLLFYMYLDYHNALWSYAYYNELGDMCMGLDSAFFWSDTIQGHVFWRDIYYQWNELKRSMPHINN